jgi:hypothetical protein
MVVMARHPLSPVHLLLMVVVAVEPEILEPLEPVEQGVVVLEP